MWLQNLTISGNFRACASGRKSRWDPRLGGSTLRGVVEVARSEQGFDPPSCVSVSEGRSINRMFFVHQHSGNRQPNFKSLSQYFGSLKILHGALCLGLLIFGVVVAVLTANGELGTDTANESLETWLPMIALAVTVTTAVPTVAVGGSLFIQFTRNQDLPKRMVSWMSATILFCAACEGAGLLWVVTALVLKNNLYLSGAGFCLVLMLAHTPTEAKTEDRLDATHEELEAAIASLRGSSNEPAH